MKSLLPIFCCMTALMACTAPSEKGLLLSILSGDDPVIQTVMEHPEAFALQILYTQIDRDSNQVPHFTSHSFRLDDSAYFYPASTVKLPGALLALEKLKRFEIPRDATMLTDSAYSGQSAVQEDTTAANGLPSVEQYIRKIMLVSDNDAFNRLYEFLGQGPLNQKLQEKGYQKTVIRHRLSIFLTPDENRHTNPVRFLQGDALIFDQEAAYNETPLPVPAPILKGKGEIIDGKQVNAPKDFAAKNVFPLSEQQRMLQSVIFPETAGGAGFDLRPEDYPFLYKVMSQVPRESQWPAYPDSSYYYDSYVKFFLYGDQPSPMPGHIRIFNKVGVAYGYLTDNAYIVDFDKDVEFFLSATLSVNENQIFNDGNYEYEEIGIPFLAELGRRVYAYEQARTKAVMPELSRFQVH